MAVQPDQCYQLPHHISVPAVSADRARQPRAYDGLVRRTVIFDPDITKKLKNLTADRGVPFNEIVNKSVRLGLALNRPVVRPKKFCVEPFALEFMLGIRRQDRKTAKGFMIDLAKSAKSCGERPDVFAIALGLHKARLGPGPEVDIAELRSELRKIKSTRA